MMSYKCRMYSVFVLRLIVFISWGCYYKASDRSKDCYLKNNRHIQKVGELL